MEVFTGSTRQLSWRVTPGSVRRPDGQRFHSDDTATDFPVNTRASNPGLAMLRSIGREEADTLTIQSHFVRTFFTSSVRITFRT